MGEWASYKAERIEQEIKQSPFQISVSDGPFVPATVHIDRSMDVISPFAIRNTYRESIDWRVTLRTWDKPTAPTMTLGAHSIPAMLARQFDHEFVHVSGWISLMSWETCYEWDWRPEPWSLRDDEAWWSVLGIEPSSVLPHVLPADVYERCSPVPSFPPHQTEERQAYPTYSTAERALAYGDAPSESEA